MEEAVYVIVARWDERDYSYGGENNSEFRCFEIVGYVSSSEEASTHCKRLSEENSKLRKKNRHEPWRDYDYELVSAL